MKRVVPETVAGADVTGYLDKRAAAAYLLIGRTAGPSCRETREGGNVAHFGQPRAMRGN